MSNLFKHFSKKAENPNSPIRVIGVYRISPTQKSIIEAAKYHECPWLLDEAGNYIDEIDWDNMENLSLIELQITGLFHHVELMEIMQDDQVPYMEFYLDKDGLKIFSEKMAEDADNRRVCFFLHFTKTKKPLMIKGQPHTLPTISDLPQRLVPFTHYLPTD